MPGAADVSVLVFAVLGAWLGVVTENGLVAGAVVGALAGWVVDLRRRVRVLERQIGAPAVGAESKAAPTSARDVPVGPAPAPVVAAAAAAQPADASDAWGPIADEPAGSRELDWAKRLVATAVHWFTTGNVPVKVGV